MTPETIELMKTVLQQNAAVERLTAQSKEAQILADSTLVELDSLQIELEHNLPQLVILLNQ